MSPWAACSCGKNPSPPCPAQAPLTRGPCRTSAVSTSSRDSLDSREAAWWCFCPESPLGPHCPSAWGLRPSPGARQAPVPGHERQGAGTCPPLGMPALGPWPAGCEEALATGSCPPRRAQAGASDGAENHASCALPTGTHEPYQRRRACVAHSWLETASLLCPAWKGPLARNPAPFPTVPNGGPPFPRQ